MYIYLFQYMWVMPSSSARCAQLPRAADKVPFYAALKKFRDYLNGMVASIDESEIVFSESKLKMCDDIKGETDLYPDCTGDFIDISNNSLGKKDPLGKKKRGRPKKVKVEGETPKQTQPRKPASSANNNLPKKKRGRPKKIKPEDSSSNYICLDQNNSSMMKCFSSPLPMQSPTNFCQMNINTNNHHNNSSTPGTPVGYSNMNNLGITHQPYTQSPQPQSQSFTHSDLSSEISAAISSEHLESPSPTSPSLGPPDFDPPTNMPTEDTTECRFSSPAPSTVSEHPPASAPQIPHSYSNYRPYTNENESYSQASAQGPEPSSEYKLQDVTSKSLSGLESLVDQIPSIADGEGVVHNTALNNNENNDQYIPSAYPVSSSMNSSTPSISHYPASNYAMSSAGYGNLPVPSNSFSVSSLSSNYSPLNSSIPPYGNLMGTPSYMDSHVPVPVTPLYPYGQQYAGYGHVAPHVPPSSIHVPGSNYPYYNTAYGGHTQAPPAPSYLPNMFDRIKPDIGYGGF